MTEPSEEIAMALRGLDSEVDYLSTYCAEITPDDVDRLAFAHMRLGNLIHHLIKNEAAE
jgi:hypothetical protein